MLAPKDNLGTRCHSRKRGIIQSSIYGNFPNINQVIYTFDTICVPNIMTLARAVLQIFCWQGSIGLQCVSQKRGIIQSNVHSILCKVNQVICIMYRNSVPDIMIQAQAVLKLFCWHNCFTVQKAKVRKREIIQPNIYRILSKVNQVIYTLDTICEPYIMILAQAVLQLFCWQGSIGLQRVSRNRGIIQLNIDRILPKGNQVIYTLDTISEPHIMILAQAVLQIFC